MEASEPSDLVERLRSLEGRVRDIERAQRTTPPDMMDLNDVTGTPVVDGSTMEYNRATGTWSPGVILAPGDIKWTASSVTPLGRWLNADGAAVSRTTYAALFDEVGTTYGAGDGSTTFNLPNLSGRFVICAGTDALGATGGERTHTLTTAEMPAHVHEQVVTAGFTGGTGDRLDYDADMPSSDAQAYDQGVTTLSTGGGGAHNNMPPYIALWAYVRY